MIFDKKNSAMRACYTAFLAALFILSSSCADTKKYELEELVLRADLAYGKANGTKASLRDVLIALKTIDSAFNHTYPLNDLYSVSLTFHRESLLRSKEEMIFEYPRFYPDSALMDFCKGLILGLDTSNGVKVYTIRAYNHREKKASDFPFFGLEISYEYGKYPRIYYRVKALSESGSGQLSAFTIKIGNKEEVNDRLLIIPQDMSFKRQNDISHLLSGAYPFAPEKETFEYASFDKEVSRDSMFLKLSENTTVQLQLKYGDKVTVWQPNKKQKEALVKLIKVFNGMQIIDEKEFLKPEVLRSQFPK